MAEFEPGRIIMQAASTEPDARVIETILDEVLKIVHVQESDFHLGSAEYTFGWNFYMLSIDFSVVRRLAQLPESDVLKVKGDSSKSLSIGLTGKPKRRMLTTGSTLPCCLT